MSVTGISPQRVWVFATGVSESMYVCEEFVTGISPQRVCMFATGVSEAVCMMLHESARVCMFVRSS